MFPFPWQVRSWTSSSAPILGMGGLLSGCDPRLPQQLVHQAQQRAQFNCARFRRMTTSGTYGFELNFKGLEPYHDFLHWIVFLGLNCLLDGIHLTISNPVLFPFLWQFCSWTRSSGPNPDHFVSLMWNSFAATGLPFPGISDLVSGCDPRMQRQAHQAHHKVQSQAQINLLQQQNTLLNQQLANQAAPHAHPLQPSFPPAQPPPLPQSPSPRSKPPTSHADNQHPPIPAFDPTEMVQNFQDNFKEELLNINPPY